MDNKKSVHVTDIIKLMASSKISDDIPRHIKIPATSKGGKQAAFLFFSLGFLSFQIRTPDEFIPERDIVPVGGNYAGAVKSPNDYILVAWHSNRAFLAEFLKRYNEFSLPLPAVDPNIYSLEDVLNVLSKSDYSSTSRSQILHTSSSQDKVREALITGDFQLVASDDGFFTAESGVKVAVEDFRVGSLEGRVIPESAKVIISCNVK